MQFVFQYNFFICSRKNDDSREAYHLNNTRRQMQFAYNNGVIVSIQDVPSGLECGCTCPACGSMLVAKKGAERAHHFAHYHREECEYGYETSLHLAAKNIISCEKRLMLPPLYLEFSGSYKDKELLAPSKEVFFDRVELEKTVSNIIPDIICYCGTRKLAVEIYVTHKIDNPKLERIKRLDLSTIEIDLSGTNCNNVEETLSKIFLQDSPEKRWVYNSYREKWLNRFFQSSDRRRIVPRGFTQHVDDCPIQKRVWEGKYYANLHKDCLCCAYCIAVNGQEIMCSGRQRISKTKDFEVPLEERIKESDRRIKNKNIEKVSRMICPYCGGDLCVRKGPYGEFVGCKSFPHCEFNAPINKETGEIIY